DGQRRPLARPDRLEPPAARADRRSDGERRSMGLDRLAQPLEVGPAPEALHGELVLLLLPREGLRRLLLEPGVGILGREPHRWTNIRVLGRRAMAESAEA